MSTQNTEPDFGEPWKCETGDFEIYSKSEHNATAYAESARIRDRIIKCVNACQGMADPAAEIEAMRAAISEAAPNFSQAMRQWRMYADMHNEEPLSDADHMEAQFFKQAAAALAKLQPYAKP